MREKLGEISCPNCQATLSIWRAKTGTGFCNCGFCGFRGFNLNAEGKIGDTVDPQALSGKITEKELEKWAKTP